MTTSVTGLTVGDYRLLGRIGEGGMGVVYLARGPDGHDVALKLLRPYVVGDDESRQRLAREVTSLRRVRSPRVAEVYDADPWGDTPYVVTRYVAGPSLHDWVKERGPLAGPALVEFALGLASALAAVHAADVLHRDIKPANVLVENGRPVLIDFGLAQLADDSRLTMSGWLLGTPGYLAPEILYGREPTPAADVHSWAATVVYAATGTGPYGSGPAAAVMDRARRGEHDLARLPPTLCSYIAWSLRPDPSDRPTEDQLVQHLSGQHPVPTVPTILSVTDDPVRHAPASEMARAYRARAVVMGLGAVTVAAGVATTSPVVAIGMLTVLIWLLSMATVRSEFVANRRRKHGRRRSDQVVAALATPAHLGLTLPATLATVLFGLLLGSVVVVTLVLLTPPWTFAWDLLVGGAVTACFAWFGPGAGDARKAGTQLCSALVCTRSRWVSTLAILMLMGVSVLAIRETLGAWYAPLPGPPWRPGLLDALPDGLAQRLP